MKRNTGDSSLHSGYGLLEKLGGMGYFAGGLWEEVPRLKTILVAERRTVSVPAFRGRYIYGVSGGEWGRRNRQGGYFAITGHTFHFRVPADKYFQDHPEYFCLIDGQRGPTSYTQGQLCTTHPDVARIIADQAI